MPDRPSPSFDLPAAHRHFSSHCFNACWRFIETADRTAQQENEMLLLTVASHWHWTQRPDYAPRKASVAWWQMARVFALLGEAGMARRCGQRSLEAIDGETDLPFYRGYAHEALARAEALAGNGKAMRRHIEQARALAAQVADERDRGLLLADLDAIS